MAAIRRIENGSITSVPGFQAAGVGCGLKPGGALDLALILAERPCACAATFTRNLFKAAPVLYDMRIVAQNPSGLRAVVINAGCANACTGEQGLRDAEATATLAAQALGVAAGDVAVMSTGVIGMPMSMSKITAGVEQAAAHLGGTVDAGHAAARAIMTTDTRPKEIAVEVTSEAGRFIIAGMAKGAGMIHPNMATMLCLLTSDAPITSALAHKALRAAIEDSFNMITVDGDTSTNDTALLMANGQAAMPLIHDEQSAAYHEFAAGLTLVVTELAKGIVRDGEGATRFIQINVRGAHSHAEAKQVAMAVAGSLLVKTAIYGRDANWGRIICAIGYSGVAFEPERVGVWLGALQDQPSEPKLAPLQLVRQGAPYDVNEQRASAILAQAELAIGIDLGQGEGEATVWTCDLSHKYVDINAHYRT